MVQTTYKVIKRPSLCTNNDSRPKDDESRLLRENRIKEMIRRVALELPLDIREITEDDWRKLIVVPTKKPT